MEKVEFNLQYADEGYGIASHKQVVKISEQTIEFKVEDLDEKETERANELAAQAWNWYVGNQEKTKTYLARALVKSLNQMRQEGKKYVPFESFESILERLNVIYSFTIADDGSFEVGFWISFNEIRYRVWVSVDDRFMFSDADILTLGGFKAPKGVAIPSLKKAENLYCYHKEHGEAVVYKHYVALSKTEINKFIDLFITDDADIDERLDLALHLALFSYACGDKLPQRFYDYLLGQEVYYYAELYMRADEVVANRLIQVLQGNNSDELPVDHLLCALSVIPCDTTKEFLQKSSEVPLPKWAKKLHVLPIEYSKVFGWQVGENGKIEKLYTEEITAFERCKKDKASPISPVKALEENCGYCGQPLTLLFDGANKLATCMYCACYETVFVKQEGGKVYWHPKNTPTGFLKDNPEYMQNDEEITERFEYATRPTKEKRKSTYTAHQYVNIPSTQMGGMPTTVNDIKYPNCPDCGKTMHFVAQFDMETVEDYGEGLYYFFTCEHCGVHGTNYDQT